MTIDDQRVAFEEWMAQYIPQSHFNRDAEDRYIMYYTDRSWLAWQAACEWKQDPCATGCKIKRAVQEMNDSLGPF